MKLKCKVDQKEAIKNGFEPNSTVVLDFEITELNPAQREALSAHFKEGELIHGYQKIPYLKTPDLTGLKQAIQEYLEEEQMRTVEKQRQVEHQIKKIDEDFNNRRTCTYTEKRWLEGKLCHNFRVTDGYGRDKNSLKFSFELEKPWLGETGMNCDHTAETHTKNLLNSPEGQAWLAELEAKNKASFEAAVEKAKQDWINRQTKRDAKAKREAEQEKFLRQAVKDHGSTMMNERMNRNLTDWPKEAMDLVARDLIPNPHNLPEFSHRDLINYETDPVKVITDDEMKLVLDYEESSGNLTCEIHTLDPDDQPEIGFGEDPHDGRHLLVQKKLDNGLVIERRFDLP